MSSKGVRFLAVVGPTASGKSAVAMALAQHCHGEIVCCDSVQLYRGFDIGSAKPSQADRLAVPHHLFDEFSATEPCDAAIYSQKAKAAISEISSRGKIPIVTGGTGLYLRAIVGENWDTDLPSSDQLRLELGKRSSDDLFAELQSLDPLRASQLHKNDRFRVVRALEIVQLTGRPVPQPRKSSCGDRDYLLVVMDPPRAVLHEAIHRRTRELLELGLVDEVKHLLAAGVPMDAKPMTSIGYSEVLSYLRGILPEALLLESIEVSTRQYAKRQCTWFKKMVRDYTLSGVSDLPPILPQLLERLT